MHTAEQLRDLALEVAEKGCGKAQAALLECADLLEAMEEFHREKAVEPRLYVNEIRQRTAEKQKARKG